VARENKFAVRGPGITSQRSSASSGAGESRSLGNGFSSTTPIFSMIANHRINLVTDTSRARSCAPESRQEEKVAASSRRNNRTRVTLCTIRSSTLIEPVVPVRQCVTHVNAPRVTWCSRLARHRRESEAASLMSTWTDAHRNNQKNCCRMMYRFVIFQVRDQVGRFRGNAVDVRVLYRH